MPVKGRQNNISNNYRITEIFLTGVLWQNSPGSIKSTHPAFRYSPLYIQRLYHIYQWVILRVTTHIGRFKGISPTDNIFSVVAQQPSSGGFIGLYLSTSWITFKRQTPECHVLCKATVNLQPMLKSESDHYWSFYIYNLCKQLHF